MRIKQVEARFEHRIYNTSSEEIKFTVEVTDDEDIDIEKVFDVLRLKSQKCLGKNYDDHVEQRYRLRQDVRALEAKLAEAQTAWNETAEFLRKQGLNPDAPSFPLRPLLASADVAEAEFDDDDVM
ncbi:MAG: hypothetical protein EAZ77_08595 [Nostocales cyanobacterium]|nr:MAG: hypothetical protein EAZ77_08595 [Nostocales cyanobacterium]